MKKTISALALIVFTIPAHANLVNNGSMDVLAGVTTNGGIYDNPGDLIGWTADGPAPGPPAGDTITCYVVDLTTNQVCNHHPYWVDPGPSPDGGSYIVVDGDPNYGTAVYQTVNGLTSGTQYTLTFWQAAAQENNESGATTEQWQVSLGSETHVSTLMHNASESDVAWNKQTLTFTATATSEVLKFLALGTPNGEPPLVLLDGVDLEPAVPEPGVFVLVGIGIAAIAAGKLNRRKAASPTSS